MYVSAVIHNGSFRVDDGLLVVVDELLALAPPVVPDSVEY